MRIGAIRSMRIGAIRSMRAKPKRSVRAKSKRSVRVKPTAPRPRRDFLQSKCILNLQIAIDPDDGAG